MSRFRGPFTIDPEASRYGDTYETPFDNDLRISPTTFSPLSLRLPLFPLRCRAIEMNAPERNFGCSRALVDSQVRARGGMPSRFATCESNLTSKRSTARSSWRVLLSKQGPAPRKTPAKYQQTRNITTEMLRASRFYNVTFRNIQI